MLASSPYDNYWYILDTDYDNYLMKYTCIEFAEKVNKQGQTPEDIAELKLRNATATYDEDYVKSETRHSIQASIQTRTLDKSYLTEEKVSSLIAHLKSMIDADEDHFATFRILEHGATCPDEAIDIFT